MSKIVVAITGELARTRADTAVLINATRNGLFTANLNSDTHYLVCALQGTKKALKASRLGTFVISEAEMNEYLEAGEFPEITLPDRPQHYANNFPEVVWDEIFSVPQTYTLSYRDARSNLSIRRVAVTGKGHSLQAADVEWLGGYDGPKFKTWRRDRILDLERV